MNDAPQQHQMSASSAYKHALEREKSGELSRGQMLAIWKEVAQNALIELGATQEKLKASADTSLFADLLPLVKRTLFDVEQVKDAHVRAVQGLLDLVDAASHGAAIRKHAVDVVEILNLVNVIKLEGGLLQLSRIMEEQTAGASALKQPKGVPPLLLLTMRQTNAISQLMGFVRAQSASEVSQISPSLKVVEDLIDSIAEALLKGLDG